MSRAVAAGDGDGVDDALTAAGFTDDTSDPNDYWSLVKALLDRHNIDRPAQPARHRCGHGNRGYGRGGVKGRVGVMVEKEMEMGAASGRVFGSLDVEREFSDETEVKVRKKMLKTQVRPTA